MRKVIWIIIVFGGLLAACGDRTIGTSSSENEVFPFPIHQEILENKLSVVTIEYPSPDVAAFYIIVRAGSREEVEPGRTGFAHFLST
jgi:zinc protease